jgi:hypothetical protein
MPFLLNVFCVIFYNNSFCKKNFRSTSGNLSIFLTAKVLKLLPINHNSNSCSKIITGFVFKICPGGGGDWEHCIFFYVKAT